MFTGSRLLALFAFLFCVPCWVVGQQPASPASTAASEPQSLADTARKLRKDKPAEVKMTDLDTKELFKSVDKVFEFASDDTGFARRSPVKKSFLGQAHSEKFSKAKGGRGVRSPLRALAERTMKKCGL